MCCFHVVDLLFFKQKTAYEMRSSDWSSDVCSSDLAERRARRGAVTGVEARFVDAGIMDGDLGAIDADRRHVAAHRFGDGEQTGGLRSGLDHLRSGCGIMAEMADVGAARLG